MCSVLLTPSAEPKASLGLIQAGSRMIAGLLFSALPVALSSCSLLPMGPMPQAPGETDRAIVSGVPFFAQDELQCGPAALAMALNRSGIALQTTDFSPEVYSPGLKGSLVVVPLPFQLN